MSIAKVCGIETEYGIVVRDAELAAKREQLGISSTNNPATMHAVSCSERFLPQRLKHT
ncbi:MAG: hypothetical protein RL532_194 [Actinomycetota bacterium]